MSIPPFSTPGRFWRGNLHTHSNLSDGALAPEQVIAAYRGAGYDFMQPVSYTHLTLPTNREV